MSATIEIDLNTVFQAIGGEELTKEVRKRLAEDDPTIQALSIDFECIEDRAFRKLGEWDRAELVKAIREDDGRRAIDVLKRCDF